MNVSEKIKNRRTELGLTLNQVGQAIGVNQSTVKRWEDGDIKSLKMDKLPALCRVLLVEPEYLLGLREDPAEITREGLQKDAADLTVDEMNEVRRYIQFVKSRRDK